MQLQLVKTTAVNPSQFSRFPVQALQLAAHVKFCSTLYELVEPDEDARRLLILYVEKDKHILDQHEPIANHLSDGDVLFMCVIPSKVSIWHDVENCHFQNVTMPGIKLFERVVKYSLAQAVEMDDAFIEKRVNVYKQIKVEWLLPFVPGGAAQKYMPSNDLQKALLGCGVSIQMTDNRKNAVDMAIHKVISDELAQSHEDKSKHLYVLLSGDKDFCSNIRRCVQAGINTLVIPNASSRQSLRSLSASQHPFSAEPVNWFVLCGAKQKQKHQHHQKHTGSPHGGSPKLPSKSASSASSFQAKVPPTQKQPKPAADLGPCELVQAPNIILRAIDKFFQHVLKDLWRDQGIVAESRVAFTPSECLRISAEDKNMLSKAVEEAEAFIKRLTTVRLDLPVPQASVYGSVEVQEQRRADKIFTFVTSTGGNSCTVTAVFLCENIVADFSVSPGGKLHTILTNLA